MAISTPLAYQCRTFLPALKKAHIAFILFRLLIVPALVCLGIFYSWWAAGPLLLLLMPVIFGSSRQTLVNEILETAERDPDFYNLLVDHHLISLFERTAPGPQGLNPIMHGREQVSTRELKNLAAEYELAKLGRSLRRDEQGEL